METFRSPGQGQLVYVSSFWLKVFINSYILSNYCSPKFLVPIGIVIGLEIVDAQLMHRWCTVAQFRNWSFNCTGCCVLGRSATTGAGLRYFNKDDACLAQWLEQIHFCNKFFKKSTEVGTFVGILFWQISYCFFCIVRHVNFCNGRLDELVVEASLRWISGGTTLVASRKKTDSPDLRFSLLLSPLFHGSAETKFTFPKQDEPTVTCGFPKI